MAQAATHMSNTRALAGEPGLVERMRKGIADFRLYLATVDELRQLSDRELADLGISRADIRPLARESVYGG
jgi:uncharacterized protein YjiS (DUF1127 family)